MSNNTILATAPLTTTGFHIKATGTTLGNSLIWDNGTNVGIGNQGTTYTLDVSGTGRFTSTLLVSGAATFSGFVGINGSPATGFPLEAYINSSTAYSSTSRGNVMRVYNSNTSANIFAGIELGGAGTANDGLAGLNAVVTGSGSAALTFYTRDSNTFAERMRITSAGNVGIGTSSPNIASFSGTCLTLEAGGSTSTKSAGVELAWAGATRSLWGGYSGGVYIGTWSNENFEIRTNATERMRITTGGNVLINATSVPVAALNYPILSVNGTMYSQGSASGIFWENRSGGVTFTTNWYGWYTTSGTIYLYNGSANIASINTSTGVYTAITPSDSRLKNNIINYNRGLSELLKLEVKEWEYSGKAGTNAGEKTIGFVADQIINVIPEWVSEYDVKLEESDEEKTQVKRIITNDLQYLLVKAIQEMNTKLDEQNQTIQNLQEQINILAK